MGTREEGKTQGEEEVRPGRSDYGAQARAKGEAKRNLRAAVQSTLARRSWE